jgi:hypothetical protein
MHLEPSSDTRNRLAGIRKRYDKNKKKTDEKPVFFD